MQIVYKDCFKFEVSESWIVDEKDELVSVYSNNGEGALTISFFYVNEMQGSSKEHISIMAKKFIEINQINLHHALILDTTQKEKIILYGTGNTNDQWFIKLWVITRFEKVIFATYQSHKKTTELKEIEQIISSLSFTFD